MADSSEIIWKIHAIHLLGGSISEYLEELGIKSITLVGDIDLIKIVCADLIYFDKIYINNIFINAIKQKNIDIFGKSYNLRDIENIDKIKDEYILLCAEKDNNKYNNSIKLYQIIEKLYIDYFYYYPLERIKSNNPNVPVCILHNPNLGLIKNKSNNENYLNSNKIGIFKLLKMLKDKNPIIPEAIKRYNSYPGYAKSITKDRTYSKVGNIYKVNDINGKYMNVIAGNRLTTDQPEKYNGIVYLFGHSVIFGRGAEDKDTIASNLQRIFNKFAKDRNILPKLVINCSNISSWDYLKMFDFINTFNYNKNDIIVVPRYHTNKINKEREKLFFICQTQNAFERPHDMGEVFIDKNIHINAEGNKKVAELLFETFENNNLLKGEYKYECGKNDHKKNSVLISDLYRNELVEYKNKLIQTQEKLFGKIGSIVMNCNPFTLGHRYLIEYAASQVKHLFIFAVEEDKSIFPFTDRFELIKIGTKDLNNVTVLPSGKFIISNLTFKDYFDKASIQDRAIDPSLDIQLFASEIAPTLNIRVRFAGEEPIDMITKQYNDTMKRLLPDYGIEFIEIPRKEFNNEVISASRVRKLLDEKNFEQIAKIVPETTLDYLKKKFI
ncbi:MAG: citrate lyase ligase [Treponema sp.]|nr:citrate lyase ligase [Treponema sp.]